MNIEQLDSTRILISLSESELAGQSLTYSTLNTHTEEGRSFIGKLLADAEKKTGIPLRGKRVLIEAMRYKSGCLLLMTVHTKRAGRRFRIRSRSGTYTFRFESADDLLECLEKTSLPPHTLTEQNGIYRLIVRHAMPGREYMHILSEYSSGAVRSDIYALSVIEHTHTLTSS